LASRPKTRGLGPRLRGAHTRAARPMRARAAQPAMARDGRGPRARVVMHGHPHTTMNSQQALSHYLISLRFYSSTLRLLRLHRDEVPPITRARTDATARHRRPTPAIPGLPIPKQQADTHLCANAKCRAETHAPGRRSGLRPRRRAPCKYGDAVPVNISTAGAKQVADEHQRLTTEPKGAMNQPEMAQAEPATCARCGAVEHGNGTTVLRAALRR